MENTGNEFTVDLRESGVDRIFNCVAWTIIIVSGITTSIAIGLLATILITFIKR